MAQFLFRKETYCRSVLSSVAESVPACALCSLGFQPVLKVLLLLRGMLQSWGRQT